MQSILINIVFALHAQASYSIVKCYYELSKRLGHALVYEETRVGYLSDEMKLMAKIHDEIATTSAESENIFQSLSAFDLILEQSSLAQCLKSVRVFRLTSFLPSVHIQFCRYTMTYAQLAF